jgi:enoyl-CoA hydratase/carnithine racemase
MTAIVARREAAVTTITLCRPQRRNALAPEHMVALREALVAAGRDPACRVIVLTGQGEAFCAGADLSGAASFFDQRRGATTELGDLIRAGRGLARPVVGRINGACHAGGVGLLALCDIAIASDTATFALPEINVGLFPFVVLAAFAGRPVLTALRELAMTGQPISAARAEQIGLVSRIVPPQALDREVGALAERLATRAPNALRAGLCRVLDEAGLAEAEARSLALAALPEAREGLAAFREKRAPIWQAIETQQETP